MHRKEIQTLKRKSIENILSLTPMQEGMLFHYLSNPGNDFYIEQLSLELFGNIDMGLFKSAWDFVIECNEMLRAVFRWEKVENPIQIILKKYAIHPDYFDLSGMKPSAQEIKLEEIKAQSRKRPFDLQDVSFRVTLCKTDPGKYVMIVENHHILYDGWSAGIIFKEFFTAYNDLYRRKKLVKPLKTGFKEFVKFTGDQRKGEKKEERFWKNYLRGFHAQTELSIKQKGKQAGYSKKTNVLFEKERKAGLEEFAETHKITLSTILYSAWGILLQRYNDSRDVIFGSTVSGRTAKIQAIEEIVGLFINTLPLRVRTNPGESIIELLGEMHNEMRQREDYESSSLVEIKKYSEINNEELFDTIVVIENYPLDVRLMVENSVIKTGAYTMVETPHYDLTVGISIGNEIDLKVIYDMERIKEESIERLIEHFKVIVEDIVKNPGKPIEEIEMLSEEEKKRLLYDFNKKEIEYPNDKTLHGLFEAQVERTPDQLSIVYSSVQITYRELDEKSNRLTHWLMGKCINPGDIVGIQVERSIEMVVGILGILKAGCAYMPINPKNPEERTRYMMEDSGAKILLSMVGNRLACSAQPLNFSTSQLLISVAGGIPLTLNTNTCYIIYTSGSTGKPKGVPISHSNISPLLYWGYRSLGIGSKDRVIHNLAYYFDWSVWEIFITLTTGAGLHIVSNEILLDPETSIDYIRTQGITILHATPTQYGYFVNEKQKLDSLKYLFIGAEKLTHDLVERSFETVTGDYRVFNMYGPTEATIISAVLEIHRSDVEKYKELSSVPIGRAVGNLDLLVLDRNQRLIPIGVIGELYISGDGVARGYLNNPQLTAERFINNPKPKTQNSKLYRTGDLVKWLEDGNIEYIGRIDQQVKIRGNRIEPGEIETQILSFDNVKEVVVVVREGRDGDRYLCAYVAPLAPGKLEISQLRNYLEKKLPVYMIPAYFIEIDKIPLNPNGKVDIKALSDPEVKTEDKETEPRDETEKKLIAIWMDVLGSHVSIGMNDSFFEIGGHSLKATRLASKIHKAFNVITPLQEIFISPTIRGMAEYIETAVKKVYSSIEIAEKKNYYECSSAQKRLYILQQMDKSSTAYNMSRALVLEGELQKDRLEEVFNRLIERHESLRTSFEIVDGEPVQRIHETVEFEIDYYNFLTEHTEDTERGLRPFDLARSPLMRVGLIELEEKKHILIVDIHHIVSDGVSTGIIIRDFIELYKGETLILLTLQYKDYSEWQNRLWEEKQGIKQKQEEYWLKRFEGEIPVSSLPTDYTRPVTQNFEGSAVHFELEGEPTAALNALAKEENTTLFMILTTVFDILLMKLSGQEEVVIGTASAGRRHSDLDHTVGMFVNTLALKSNPCGEKTTIDLLKEVEATTLEGFENQDYPFEDLVEKVVKTRDLSRNPLFDVMFVLQNLDIPTIEIPGLTLTSIEYETGISKFDMTFICEKRKDTLYFTVEYSIKLYRVETIERFTKYFKKLISIVLEEPEKKLSDLEIITEEEKRQLLYDFNKKEIEYSKDKTIHGLFKEQVEKTPDHVAIVYSSIQITYRELDEKSNRLTWWLIEKDIHPSDIVGIQVERSIEMIVGILGILKSGAAYMPINPKNPEERTRYMMEDTGAKILLSMVGNRLACYAQPLNFSTSQLLISFSSVRKNFSQAPSYAYVIYTSGSTGKPKGVPITHTNISPLLHWGYRNLGIGTKDRVIHNLSYYFDWSVWEIFITLTTGAGLHIVSDEMLLNPRASIEYTRTHGISILHATPTQYGYFVNEKQKIESLKYLFIGAEKLTHDLVERSFETVTGDCRIFNMYGPTESTIISAVLEIHSPDVEGYKELSSVPIGRAVGNLDLHVLDKYLKLCPIGVTGELFITGDGVAEGYLNNPQLTAERFVNNQGHFLKKPPLDLPGMQSPAKTFIKKTLLTLNTNTFYKTGDLVKRLPDGNIEYIGRIDHQVKIRGNRIELGEIENRLMGYIDIKDVVVVARDNADGEKYLCAYIVPRTPGALDNQGVRDLRDYLEQKLPSYMIPAYFVEMEKIPLNPNGKVDKRALPEPVEKGSREYVAPGNFIEEKLVEIWADVLKLKSPVGIDDNFFELGGHSLKATLLAIKIQEYFNIDVSLTEIFKAPSIRGMSSLLKVVQLVNYREMDTKGEVEEIIL